MISPESRNYDFEPVKESIDLDAKYNTEYRSEHAKELNNILLFMEDEVNRKPEMEKDATSKASKIHEEIVFHKGAAYQNMVQGISSILSDSKANLELPNDIDLENKEYPFDYLVSNCLQLNYDNGEAICQTISNGIFDILGLKEDKRPVLTFIASIDNRASSHADNTNLNDAKDELGCFKEPGVQFHHINPLAEKNGVIKINLPNFDNEPDVRDILTTLEHECFHAYQFNCRRGSMPITTVRDWSMMAAYNYAHDQYINSNNDFESYYEQGYESSARSFSNQLSRATEIVITEAIKQAAERK